MRHFWTPCLSHSFASIGGEIAWRETGNGSVTRKCLTTPAVSPYCQPQHWALAPSFLSGFSRLADASSLEARFRGGWHRASPDAAGRTQRQPERREGRRGRRRGGKKRVGDCCSSGCAHGRGRTCHNRSLRPHDRRQPRPFLSGYPYVGARAYLEARFRGEGHRETSEAAERGGVGVRPGCRKMRKSS